MNLGGPFTKFGFSKGSVKSGYNMLLLKDSLGRFLII